MKQKRTLTNRAVDKVIKCIDSSTNLEHIVACNKMIQLIYKDPYNITKKTLTYLTLKYRKKRAELQYE